MQRVDRPLKLLWVAALLGSQAALPALAESDEADFLYRAPISMQRSAPFVELPLTPATYARSLGRDLADLRVVDARGERVPFALMAPPEGRVVEARTRRPARLYPLPARPVGSTEGPGTFELSLENGRLSLRQGAAPATAAGRSPGWLVDLGEPAAGQAPPAFIEVGWSGPAEFSAGYRLETSDDLRQWRHGGSGQLMALVASGGTLTQPLVALADPPGRYVKLEWLAGDEPPALATAQAVSVRSNALAAEPLAELRVAAASEVAPEGGKARAVVFDLGAPLPLTEATLSWKAGTRVVPARVQGRLRPDQPWTELTRAVFYRLEREGSVSESPPVQMAATARYLRVLPDERAAALAPAGTELRAHVALGRVVFAAQGEPPFALLAGSTSAAPGALPIQGLVPSLQEERARFGSAHLGEWEASAPAVARAEAAHRRAAWRPWLLWGALLAAVAALAAMVWRLARGAAQG